MKYQKSHSFAALTRSISDTSPTRVKVPHARAFHEVIYISLIGSTRIMMLSSNIQMLELDPSNEHRLWFGPINVHICQLQNVDDKEQISTLINITFIYPIQLFSFTVEMLNFSHFQKALHLLGNMEKRYNCTILWSAITLLGYKILNIMYIGK